VHVIRQIAGRTFSSIESTIEHCTRLRLSQHEAWNHCRRGAQLQTGERLIGLHIAHDRPSNLTNDPKQAASW